MKLSEIGITITYLGLTKNGHLPAVCSVNMAINLSILPNTALWIITGLANPYFPSISCKLSSFSLYESPNLMGKLKSNYTVPH